MVYKVLLAAVGLRHYWPYRSVVILLDVCSGLLIYVVARRRVGPWLAIIPATLLMFLGSAWQDLLWAFQMGFLGSVAAGLGALALLDPRGSSLTISDTGRNLAASALVTVSLACSGVGVAFLIALGVLLITDRARLTRMWIVAAPAALFALWYLGWGTSEHVTGTAALGAPQYLADAASSSAAGLTGLSQSYGAALFVALLVGLLHDIKRRLPGPILMAALIGAGSFWLLSAVTRADVGEPMASRYVYVGGSFILLAIIDAARERVVGRRMFALIAILTLGALVANVGQLRAGERGLRSADTPVQAALPAIQVAAKLVAPAFLPEPHDAPDLQAGPFLSASRGFGSPGLTLAQLQASPESLRTGADTVLARAEQLRAATVVRLVPSRPLRLLATTIGGVSTHGDCDSFAARGPQDVLDLEFSGNSHLFVAPAAGHAVSVYLRRFGSAFSEPPFTKLSTMSSLGFPVDLRPQLPWEVRLTSSAPFRACGG
jgi:hypothetical protein